MEDRLLAVLTSGLKLNVSVLCNELEISRESFYKYRRRFEAEGVPGLAERSRRPLSSPNQTSASLEDEIVRLRKELSDEAGYTVGAQTIAYRLIRAGIAAPAVSTIHRVLHRRGLVVPEPKKRPHAATTRFVWPRPNDAWQIDATQWALADDTAVWIVDLLDDHSRLSLAARAHERLSDVAVFDAFFAAVRLAGLPAHVMSDNGFNFTGRFNPKRRRVAFEDLLAELSVVQILSRPFHPQTCGKLERWHQTLKKWLRAQPKARSLAELQDQLDAFRDFYNHRRPHRALAGATPYEAWNATARAVPSAASIVEVPRASLHTVSSNGHFGWRAHLIRVPFDYRGTQVLAVARGLDITVHGPGGVIQRQTIDPTRRYQPRPR